LKRKTIRQIFDVKNWFYITFESFSNIDSESTNNRLYTGIQKSFWHLESSLFRRKIRGNCWEIQIFFMEFSASPPESFPFKNVFVNYWIQSNSGNKVSFSIFCLLWLIEQFVHEKDLSFMNEKLIFGQLSVGGF
jgi:hypothetical protein